MEFCSAFQGPEKCNKGIEEASAYFDIEWASFWVVTQELRRRRRLFLLLNFFWYSQLKNLYNSAYFAGITLRKLYLDVNKFKPTTGFQSNC